MSTSKNSVPSKNTNQIALPDYVFTYCGDEYTVPADINSELKQSTRKDLRVVSDVTALHVGRVLNTKTENGFLQFSDTKNIYTIYWKKIQPVQLQELLDLI